LRVGATAKVVERFEDLAVLAKAGLLRPMRPDVLMRGVLAVVRHGISPAAACEYGAARYPDEPAVVDDRGAVTFVELAGKISALAEAWRARGIGHRDRVGLLCRNHREFVESVAALSSLGADIAFLNVSFAGPQLAEVLGDQRVTALVYDEEFAPQAKTAASSMRRFVAFDLSRTGTDPRVEELDCGAGRRFVVGAHRGSRFLFLTSGTTGQPKASVRPVPLSIDPLVALLSRIPLRSRDVTLIASPVFHTWGFGLLGLSMVLSSTVVLARRFDPEPILDSIEQHGVRVLVTVPYVLQRMTELPARLYRSHDYSSLEVVMTSGSPLSGQLAARFMDTYGEVLYNVYGSTEAAWAAIATPADLRAAPGTVGFPPRGTEVRIVDADGLEVPSGQMGRVLVRNALLAPTGSDGQGRELFDGYLSTGDLGRFDEAGRLHIDGRQDDMIISGGENVHPQEVEELLVSHPAIAEALVIGVPDRRFGQRLRAFVVPREGVELSVDDVREFVRGHLASYKVPRDVRFVEALSRNEIGKVLHRDPHG
jgi:acyl-CoA synthetase (AMP-forming)/AMP-acid ligase II